MQVGIKVQVGKLLRTSKKIDMKLPGIFKHILDGLLGGIEIFFGWLNISSTFVNLQYISTLLRQ